MLNFTGNIPAGNFGIMHLWLKYLIRKIVLSLTSARCLSKLSTHLAGIATSPAHRVSILAWWEHSNICLSGWNSFSTLTICSAVIHSVLRRVTLFSVCWLEVWSCMAFVRSLPLPLKHCSFSMVRDPCKPPPTWPPSCTSVWGLMEGDGLGLRLSLGKAGPIPAVALLPSPPSFHLLAAGGIQVSTFGLWSYWHQNGCLIVWSQITLCFHFCSCIYP